MVYEAIRNYLVDSGVKQAYVARKLHIGENTLSLMLTGKRKITADEFLEICRALGVSPERFAS